MSARGRGALRTFQAAGQALGFGGVRLEKRFDSGYFPRVTGFVGLGPIGSLGHPYPVPNTFPQPGAFVLDRNEENTSLEPKPR